MNRLVAFLRHLVAWERLPRDEVATPPRRPGLLRSLTAQDPLPRDADPAPAAARPGVLRWLIARERLPLDPPTTPTEGAPDPAAPGARRQGDR